MLNRRTFVKGLVGTSTIGSSFLLGSCTSLNAAAQNVAVIGAGLAGLSAATELVRAGVNVTVFEQAQRVGGRLHTVRGHFDDNAWIDAGAQSAGQSYMRWREYCNEFGLTVEELTSETPRPDSVIYLNNTRFSGSALRNGTVEWPVNLHENERKSAPFGLLRQYLVPQAKKIGSVEALLDPQYAEFDELSLLEFLQREGASEAAIGLIERGLNYNSLSSVSSLSALRDVIRTFVAPGPSLRVEGGNGLLTDAMAAKLAGNVKLGFELQQVDTSGARTKLLFNTADGVESHHCDEVVIALPFTALRKVNFRPSLPASRQQMINDLPYTQITNTFMQTRTRFWEKSGAFSALYSDTKFERVFNLSRQISSDRGMLINWVNGVGVANRLEQSDVVYQQQLSTWLQRVWPNSGDQIEKTYTADWSSSYSGGAYAHYAPGQLQRFAPELPKALGSIYFAGEHTALVEPGMEGALASGQRAAAGILNARSQSV